MSLLRFTGSQKKNTALVMHVSRKIPEYSDLPQRKDEGDGGGGDGGDGVGGRLCEVLRVLGVLGWRK